MAIFYRGAGIGTYWHTHDARQTGFVARAPQMQSTVDRLMLHIARGTVNSPFISLTRSYGIALNYAIFFGNEVPTRECPAYVYEIEINEPIPPVLKLLVVCHIQTAGYNLLSLMRASSVVNCHFIVADCSFL